LPFLAWACCRRSVSAFAGGLLLPHFYVNFMRARRFKRFSAEFANAMDVIVRGLKSGLPLADCMKIIAAEAQEPVRSEFKAIIEDQAMGMPSDEAVQRLPQRMPVAEASFFAIVIAIQSRTGGSLSEALGNLSKVLRERKKMQAKIKAMSSEAKSSAGIIGALPVFVTGAIYCHHPGLHRPAVHHLPGQHHPRRVRLLDADGHPRHAQNDQLRLRRSRRFSRSPLPLPRTTS
jgi:Flp pilus assembly protein TadB